MRPSHLFIVLLLALIIFGAPRLPGVARSIGESLKILKKEVGELAETDSAPQTTPASSSMNASSPSTLAANQCVSAEQGEYECESAGSSHPLNESSRAS